MARLGRKRQQQTGTPRAVRTRRIDLTDAARRRSLARRQPVALPRLGSDAVAGIDASIDDLRRELEPAGAERR